MTELRRFNPWTLLSIALMTFGASGYAVAQSRGAGVQEEIDVNLVELVVRAEHLSGKTLRGLTRGDFVVHENGRRQTIDSIEEVDLNAMNADEQQANRSRFMILLDFKNTEFVSMRPMFKNLREFATIYDHGSSELGLAINGDGIVEIQPFTKDRDAFLTAIDRAENYYHNSRYRNTRSYHMDHRLRHHRGFFPNYLGHYGHLGRPVLGPEHLNPNHYRQELEILGQFVNYLGAYSGRKDLLLISNPWDLGSRDDTEGASNQPEVLSIKDIQTTALFNKVSVNVLSLEPHENIAAGRFGRIRNDNYFDRTSEIAANTAGVFYRVQGGAVPKMLERVNEEINHYYRIRYYSNAQNDRYRRVQVKVKGITKLANHFAGYYPQSALIPAQTVGGVLRGNADEMALAVNAEWMAWTHAGWKKRRANVAVSYRAYDENGVLIAEQVKAAEMRVKKRRGAYTYPILAQKVAFNWADGQQPAWIEATVVDLTSGERVFVKNNLASF
ncbi:VWA domain-containing protein [Acanthopleuribacter pedis]|uniref:VWA domain-containing protein n=1 Tax=Acanthopleuribacter pedis TaxID=442870 RepID=A0A8J7U4F6_9BACT|nr:VWA domain-containing protein [Acanthopleuribacter pedis]MBO1320597.1 VWA domain-containing protein [Acanthopleuribacter pedis]